MVKALHENFTKFFEKPTREGFKDLIENHIGEANHIDFKESLPEKNKLAKHFLAFANTGGGVLVIGVSEGESLETKGVNSVIDKSDIQKQVAPYIPSSLEYEVLDFSYSAPEYPKLKGKSFQVIIVESMNEDLPYLCKKNGDGIKENIVYVRKGTNSTEANHEDLQKIINKRIETQYSSSNILTLEEHLFQLKLLYKQIPKTINNGLQLNPDSFFGGIAYLIRNMNTALYKYEENPHYPRESFQEFVSKLINSKKARIKNFIDV